MTSSPNANAPSGASAPASASAPSDSPAPPVAPELPYRPRDPRAYRPAIALVGCGGITHYHLLAYQNAGYRVVALCDLDLAKAVKRRDAFFPEARVLNDPADVFQDDEIEVVDITTHPPERPPLIEAALRARKHVLSQKPFVLDLDVGQRLADLADQRGARLAVNQNARWAPHFAYARAAVEAGLLGDVAGVHMSVHWDHSWVRGTEFEKIKHLILYDYAIHWFDMVNCLLRGRVARRVYASTAPAPGQTIAPRLLGQALLEFDDAQASLAFDAFTPIGAQDRSFVAGGRGGLSSVGPGNRAQTVTITTAAGAASPPLVGSWFPDGFHGTMGELLCAIEENREPTIGAADNLKSLALCFAAVASAERHEPVAPGAARRLPA